MKKFNVKYLKSLIIIFGVIILFTAALVPLKQKPPVQQLSIARVNIAKAQQKKASKYTKELYSKSTMYYELAMKEWQKENERQFFFRNYDLVEKYALQANYYALKAIENLKEI